MKILVLNAGSSSHKLCLYAVNQQSETSHQPPPAPLWEGQIDWHPEQDLAALEARAHGGQCWSEQHLGMARSQALLHLLKTLWQGPTQVLEGLSEIDAVGHRIVHGGPNYQRSVVITKAVKQAIADLIPLAPVHNPANLEGIEVMEQLLAEHHVAVPQVAAFDTAFHSSLPDVAKTYPGPYAWVQQGIRRYGFHGISHQYCAQRAAQILERDESELRQIICHLGNGSSLTAVRNGQSIDTTMGFTPLEGLMMGTRSGSIDPGILLYLLRQGLATDELDHLLNQESGLKGISGISHDLRDIAATIAAGNDRAQLTLDLYLHRLKACLGSMLMSLGGLDVLVFTAGIGENHAPIRAAVCESLAFLGAEIDAEKNQDGPVDVDIATAASAVRVLVIHTQEDWAIAKKVYEIVTRSPLPVS